MSQEVIRNIAEEELIRHRLFDERKSAFQKYRDLVVGGQSLLQLIKYEILTTLLGPLPGALGLVLRKLFYPMLFANIGKGVIFGRSVVIRHPDKIRLGNGVILDDYSVVDARGAGEEGVVIGDKVIINRGVAIQAKVGGIRIGSSSNVGANTVITAQGGVFIGEAVHIAGGCYISGGAFEIEKNSASDRIHGKFTRGPIQIDKHCHLGMLASVLDGVHLEEGVIVGTASVVAKNAPAYTIVLGNPARVIQKRE
jgi:acetyltransferase-like isoleucine patch superfamily enzyme